MAKINGQSAFLHASVEELRKASPKLYKKSYLCSRMETKYSALDMGRSDSFLEKTAPALGFYFLF